MSNGAFVFLKASGLTTRQELRGYAARSPGLAAAFAVLLFGLGGMPPAVGLLAKLLILWQAVRASLAVPAVLAAFSSLVSLVYYLALVRDAWFEDASGPAPAEGGAPERIVVLACALGTLALGAAPLLLKDLAGSAWR
jgi:NADH:ubiquinone oxidoreductase subunit 2 (subunit N)